MTEKENQVNNSQKPTSEEAGLIAARELLREGILPLEEIAEKTGLSEMVVRGLKGAQARAQKKLLEAQAEAYRQEVTSEPSRADSQPEKQIQAAIQPKLEATVEEENEEEEDTASTVPNAMPGTKLDYTTILNMREMLTEKQRPLFDSYIKLAEQKQNQMVRNDGHGNDGMGSTSADEELKRAEAETEREYGKMLRDERMRGRIGKNDHENEAIKELKQEIRDLKQSMQNNPLGYMKLGVDAFKSGVDAVPKAQGADPSVFMNVYRAGRQDEQKTYENAIKQGESNLNDLKIEEIKQHEHVDMRKLDLEEKLLDHKLEHEGDMMKSIETITKNLGNGVIGDAIKGIGQGAADRIRGQGVRIPMAEAQCPCGAKFKVNASLPSVQCPMCGNFLTKAQPPQPTPEQPAQSSEPATQASQTTSIVPVNAPTGKEEYPF
jgi:hypothetical protein